MKQSELNTLKQQAVTEPNSNLRAQYAQAYAKALESITTGEQTLVKDAAPADLAKGAVDAVKKSEWALRRALTALTEAGNHMANEWDDSAALIGEIGKARDIIASLRQKMNDKQEQYKGK